MYTLIQPVHNYMDRPLNTHTAVACASSRAGPCRAALHTPRPYNSSISSTSFCVLTLPQAGLARHRLQRMHDWRPGRRLDSPDYSTSLQRVRPDTRAFLEGGAPYPLRRLHELASCDDVPVASTEDWVRSD